MSRRVIAPSQLAAEEHRRYVIYHVRVAIEHSEHGEPEAAAQHRTAADLHYSAADTPLDNALSSSAMRASAMADEVSQRVRKARR